MDRLNKILVARSLKTTYHPFPEEQNVVGGYRSLVELVKKRFTAMMETPKIASALTFFKKNIVWFLEPTMTNSYIRFLNFLGVGSSPTMIPWLNGGNFAEGSETFQWLHQEVINSDIEALEKLVLPIPKSESSERMGTDFPTGQLVIFRIKARSQQ